MCAVISGHLPRRRGIIGGGYNLSIYVLYRDFYPNFHQCLHVYARLYLHHIFQVRFSLGGGLRGRTLGGGNRSLFDPVFGPFLERGVSQPTGVTRVKRAERRRLAGG